MDKMYMSAPPKPFDCSYWLSDSGFQIPVSDSEGEFHFGPGCFQKTLTLIHKVEPNQNHFASHFPLLSCLTSQKHNR